MSPAEAQRIVELFEQVVDLPPVERRGVLEGALAGREALRQEVEGLLAADAELAAPATDRRIGPYRLVRQIGEGGMSRVYLGLRDDGELEQRVAVKLIRPEVSTADMVRRFEIERQILASLDHPAIARVLDAGHTADGLPYFVMEHIEGEPIDRYCDRHRLTVPERLRLFLQVCAAIQFAHQNLIVHRDVKPSNVLVTAGGQVKLLDFGIAKLLNPGLMLRAVEPTAPWARLLTPEYASPEQLRGEPATMASDVYALGVLLYKLLTGSVPHQLADLRAPETMPEAPSARVRRELAGTARSAEPETLAALRSTQPRALARKLAGALDAIALKALCLEPRRRYPSAESLTEDVQRYLTGKPAATKAVSVASEWLGRWPGGRRRWLPAALLCGLLLGLAALALYRHTVRVAVLQAEIEAQQGRVRTILGTFECWLATAVHPSEGGGEPTVKELLDRAAERIRNDLAAQPEAQADLLMALGAAYSRMGLWERAAAVCESALRVRERRFGRDHEQVAASLVALATAEARQNNVEVAAGLHQRALAIRRKVYRGDDLEVAESLVELARALLAGGHPASAEPLLLEALGIRERLLGGWDLHVAEVLTELGHAVGALQSPSAAEILFSRAARIGRRQDERVSPAPARGSAPPQRVTSPALPAAEGSPSVACIPDGGFASVLDQPCCSGVAIAGTTLCTQPDDWGSTWASCRHVCGTRLVAGCVPPGGVTDTLALTDCCSGRAVNDSTRCLQPADYGTTWRTCVLVCV